METEETNSLKSVFEKESWDPTTVIHHKQPLSLFQYSE